MKKPVTYALLLSLMLIFTACGTQNTSRTATQANTVKNVLEQQTNTADVQNEPTSSPAPTATPGNTTAQPVKYETFDIDLTSMSSSMVYSEVSNILQYPDPFFGMIVRMKGNLMSYYDETDGNTYYSCIIQDATACCSNGIEFQLSDYSVLPEEGEEIEVAGVLDSYEIGDYKYITLKDAELR